MIDINAIINNAITNAVINTVNAAVAQATQPLVERIAALETRLTEAGLFQKETNVTVDMDALRELVTPLVGSMVEAKIEEAISAHQEEYDHDEYDRMLRTMEDHDLDDFVKSDELDSNVRDAVRDLSFEVSVS
jgi:hypothetical protein